MNDGRRRKFYFDRRCSGRCFSSKTRLSIGCSDARMLLPGRGVTPFGKQLRGGILHISPRRRLLVPLYEQQQLPYTDSLFICICTIDDKPSFWLIIILFSAQCHMRCKLSILPAIYLTAISIKSVPHHASIDSTALHLQYPSFFAETCRIPYGSGDGASVFSSKW